MDNFDIRMEVKLCSKHKAIYEKLVLVKLESGRKCIRPKALLDLWKEAETCLDCEWQTRFGKC